MEALGELQVLTRQLVRQEQIPHKLQSYFPLITDNDLLELERKIQNDNKSLYVTAVRGLVRNNLCKNINLILSAELLYEFNVDGTHGKKRLKDYKNFFAVILDVVSSTPDINDVDVYIRKAIQLSKKRHLKKIIGDKQNNEVENSNDDPASC
ncbi:uncharacterized protein LOC142240970 [Haematobia irritans]|uniref:uncharacterized protein LOC142240970 n=1 Tax=Haematobia irritans TaxID=7368 RepID=UPI003F50BD3E